MMTDIDDDTMASKRNRAPIDDQRVSDKPAETPAEFDLAGWLAGLAPARAVYTLVDAKFELQARLPEWAGALRTELGEDFDPGDFDLHFLAGHIVAPQVTVDDLRAMREVAGPEVREMVGLAVDLDTKPRAQISPRFLR